MSSHTRATYVESMAPFGLLGVPTQISESAASPIASATSVVARRRPAATGPRRHTLTNGGELGRRAVPAGALPDHARRLRTEGSRAPFVGQQANRRTRELRR